ncbi:MAG: hypothetical protein JST59_01685 [Actinobacteria bacterium]|nr:hypothetical protein [Actinomycetota bacterium]
MISTGYLVILSQIGCPVPAEAYSACLFNMLLSKLKNNVSIENGLSHFQYEVVVLNGLLEANEPNMRALVLIDEILKGTNYEEELSISLGFLRYLQGMRGFVIAMISDEELIRHIGTSFDYVRIINAIGERQSVTSACDKLGICEQFADIVRTYEERHNEAQESGILPKFDP